MNPEGSVLASPLLSASWKAAEVAFSWVLLPLLPFFLQSFDFFFFLETSTLGLAASDTSAQGS